MSLKISDAFRLSYSNISQHKKRSAIIIFTISLLFGIVMGLGFIVSGIEKTIISASARQTKENIYVQVEYNGRDKNSSKLNTPDSIFSKEEISRVDLKPRLDEAADAKIRERVSRYGGEVVGYYWCYMLGYSYCAGDKVVAEGVSDKNFRHYMP